MVAQRETGRFTRGVETVGVHPSCAPAARAARSRRPQTAQLPSPATAYCSATRVHHVKGAEKRAAAQSRRSAPAPRVHRKAASAKETHPFYAKIKRKEQTYKHLLFGNSILAELLLLCACSLRLLAALYARAFIMLTLAELGKRTRLGARTLEATQRAVNRLIFLDADLRHSFPSLRTFPSGGSLSTAVYRFTQNRKDIISDFRAAVNYFFPQFSIFSAMRENSCIPLTLRQGLRSCPEQRSA